MSYFQLAAHGGHLHAIFNLGEMNAEGKVVKRNCNFAVEVSWYTEKTGYTESLCCVVAKLLSRVHNVLLVLYM